MSSASQEAVSVPQQDLGGAKSTISAASIADKGEDQTQASSPLVTNITIETFMHEKINSQISQSNNNVGVSSNPSESNDSSMDELIQVNDLD